MTKAEQFEPHLVDIKRAIIDMRDEQGDDTPEDYVALLHLKHRGTESYDRFESRIGERAMKIQYEYQTYSCPGGVASRRVPVNPDATPGIFKRSDLHYGFTLGLDVTRKMLGNSSEQRLAPYVDTVMNLSTQVPVRYAARIGDIGWKVYNNRLSTPSNRFNGFQDPLRIYVEGLIDDIYDGTSECAKEFKTGVGLARKAFNLLRHDMDDRLHGIESVSGM